MIYVHVKFRVIDIVKYFLINDLIRSWVKMMGVGGMKLPMASVVMHYDV